MAAPHLTRSRRSAGQRRSRPQRTRLHHIRIHDPGSRSLTTHALDNARRSLRRAVWRAPRACPQPLWSWRRADPRAGRPAAQRTARSAPLRHAPRAHDPRCPADPVAHTSSRRDTRPRMSLRHTAAHAHASSCTRPLCHGSRTRMRTPRLLGKLNRHGISWQCSAPAPHPHCISHWPVFLSLAAIRARRPPHHRPSSSRQGDASCALLD